LIKKGRTDAARREFSYALERNEKFSPAHRGMALVYALEGDYPAAFEAVHSAVRHTEKNSAREDIHKAFDRLQVGDSTEGKIRGNGNRLVQSKYLVKYFLDVYYYAGVAFRTGGAYRELESVLIEALRVNRAFMEEAEKQMQFLRTMKQSRP
jgi:tetratricopeptide (TPR) repeat protein